MAEEQNAPESFADKFKANTRRTFAQAVMVAGPLVPSAGTMTTAAVGTTAAAVALTQASCTKSPNVAPTDPTDPTDPVDPTHPAATSSIDAGTFAVYYGKNKNAYGLNQYGGVVVEPAYISAADAKARGINAYGYASLTSLVPPGTESSAEYHALYNAIVAEENASGQGFLKNAKGEWLRDPTIGNAPPSPYMVELRNPVVYKLMKDYAVKMGGKNGFPMGLHLDSGDTGPFIETVKDSRPSTEENVRLDPSAYNGYAQTEADLLVDIGQSIGLETRTQTGTTSDGKPIYNYPKGIILIGGLQQPPTYAGECMLNAAAQVNCTITQEGKRFLKAGQTSTPTDVQWISGRLQVLANLAKAKGRPYISVNALEPVDSSLNYDHVVKETAKMYKGISSELSLPLKTHIFAASTNSAGYFTWQNEQDLAENLKFKGQTLAKVDNTRVDGLSPETLEHYYAHQDEFKVGKASKEKQGENMVGRLSRAAAPSHRARIEAEPQGGALSV